MWEVSFKVSQKVISVFEKCLEPFAQAISCQRHLDYWLLKAYLSKKPDETLIESIVAETASLVAVANPSLTIRLMPEINWVAESLKGLRPISVGRFIIYGSHNDKPTNQHLIGLEIDAGEAFGTGHHATTKGCLMALSRLNKPKNNIRMLDLGCGAAVLALAAAKLWKIKVLAGDIDPTAVRVAKENVRKNKLHKSISCVASDGFDSARLKKEGPFDVIVANILSEPLRRLARPMRMNSRPNATIILSGILSTQSPAIISTYRSQGFHLQSRLQLDGWTTLILTNPR